MKPETLDYATPHRQRKVRPLRVALRIVSATACVVSGIYFYMCWHYPSLFDNLLLAKFYLSGASCLISGVAFLLSFEGKQRPREYPF
jgi:uncharacterized membrane protein